MTAPTINITSIDDLMDFAAAWSDLGDAIAEQVKAVLLGEDEDENPAAIRHAVRVLEDFPEVVRVLTEWLEGQS